MIIGAYEKITTWERVSEKKGKKKILKKQVYIMSVYKV